MKKFTYHSSSIDSGENKNRIIKWIRKGRKMFQSQWDGAGYGPWEFFQELVICNICKTEYEWSNLNKIDQLQEIVSFKKNCQNLLISAHKMYKYISSCQVLGYGLLAVQKEQFWEIWILSNCQKEINGLEVSTALLLLYVCNILMHK